MSETSVEMPAAPGAPYATLGEARASLPRWVPYGAVAQFILLVVGGGVLLFLTLAGALPASDYTRRITEQGNSAGYFFLFGALLWIGVCLLAAGIGATRVSGDQYRSTLLVGPAIWIWLFVVGVPCLLIGGGLEANVLHDLQAGPATLHGTVTSEYADDEQGTDSHGNTYYYEIYHLTIAGVSFSSSNDNMADVFTRVPEGKCGVATYGRYSQVLTDMEPCG